MILARHAESLLWAGRFLERAEMTSRWLDVASRSAMHLAPGEAESQWRQLIEALALRADFADRPFDQTTVSAFLLTDQSHPGSVRSCGQALRDNLRVARDRVPVELWEAANRLHLQLSGLVLPENLDGAPTELFRAVREGCQAISGVIGQAMTRDEGYAFMVMGRSIERAVLTTQLLATSVRANPGAIDADRILRCCSALQAYRRINGHRNSQDAVLKCLLTTPNLPRSVLACLVETEQRLGSLNPNNPALGQPQRLTGRLRSMLEYGDWTDLGGSEAIEVLEELHAGLLGLAAAISSNILRPMGDPILHAQFVRPGTEMP